MTPSEHQQTVDIAQLVVNQYFDHYLTDVFPGQMREMFAAHNQDAEAHEPRLGSLVKMKRQIDRLKWMIAGGSAVAGFVGALIVQHWSQLVQILFP